MKKIKEDAVPANCVAGGKVDGIGIGPNGEPGVAKGKRKKMLRRSLRDFL